MASKKTQAAYLAAGMSFLNRARERFAGMADVEALCAHAEARTQTLRPSTVNLFRQQYRSVLKELAEAEQLDQATIEASQRRIEHALARVRGKPAVKNTASKKVKDARAWMVKEVFGHLRLAAIRHERVRLAATALYCLLIPLLGTRPFELQGAHIDGDFLIIRNAKRNDGSTRSLPLSGLHPSRRMALWVMLEITRSEMAHVGYQRWLRILAENLARACISASREGYPIPRLSPSSFRHTAISTWAAAGYTVEEIAEMAGHLSLFSARRSYIHRGAAWAQRAGEIILPTAPPTAAATPIDPASIDEIALMVDDFPTPAAKPTPAQTGASGNHLWAEFRARLNREHDRGREVPLTSQDLPSPPRRRS